MSKHLISPEELRKKIEAAKAGGPIDLSSDEDLSIAVMNLVSLEEHFFFTAEKTKKPEYLDLLAQIREIRKEYMGKLLPKTEGETWCVSKHLLAAAMRLMEVGTKELAKGGPEAARKTFDSAYHLYSLFWAIRLKVIDLPDTIAEGKKEGWSAEDIVEKLVDCCNE